MASDSQTSDLGDDTTRQKNITNVRKSRESASLVLILVWSKQGFVLCVVITPLLDARSLNIRMESVITKSTGNSLVKAFDHDLGVRRPRAVAKSSQALAWTASA
ncbi:hypothetical protein N7478_002110 [Penicillium angulare]|uniref:uncharacterized protein n=1 Tax=Penicillium angulare TaxID=116970 RepID=UPI0025405E6D|nr:uncharacterized protein N7478_002110 [Penicillium angulare]KAJ5289080.1 hypothetical protein N7478_002110 [Penicillium angulare]